MNDFKYQTNLETVLEDLKWVDTNINTRYLLDGEKRLKEISEKIKQSVDYYNFRQNRLIGAIRKLTALEKSELTEYFPSISQETKELIIPAIKIKEVVGEILQSCPFCGFKQYGIFYTNSGNQWCCKRCHPPVKKTLFKGEVKNFNDHAKGTFWCWRCSKWFNEDFSLKNFRTYCLACSFFIKEAIIEKEEELDGYQENN